MEDKDFNRLIVFVIVSIFLISALMGNCKEGTYKINYDEHERQMLLMER